ncbi:hypothetical protein H5410_016283 [Solanum commersonii]|uniref:Uncharacterized protein n=1 Tax=Solanum commersonii TaxID=4109 RepID=A0A9J5ZWK8_SOLCO|nr:hypothetical protein H5410_016283 [Solanum commersonii]
MEPLNRPSSSKNNQGLSRSAPVLSIQGKTKQGALYYIEEQGRGDEEIEVKNFIRNGEWDRQKLRELISAEMTEYIVENIASNFEEGAVDKPWWMGNSSGNSPSNQHMIITWKKRIATEDNLKKMRISIASRSPNRRRITTYNHTMVESITQTKIKGYFSSCPDNFDVGAMEEEKCKETWAESNL